MLLGRKREAWQGNLSDSYGDLFDCQPGQWNASGWPLSLSRGIARTILAMLASIQRLEKYKRLMVGFLPSLLRLFSRHDRSSFHLRASFMPNRHRNLLPLPIGLRSQISRLVPALFACFGPTIGLFIFGWTARPDVHWIAPTIGIVIYGASVFVSMQCIFVYVPLSYPQYAASLFAGNDFFRSALACGSILFGRPLFINLGIGKGVSLLGRLSVIGILGMFVLWFFGAKMRSRSKFAVA